MATIVCMLTDDSKHPPWSAGRTQRSSFCVVIIEECCHSTQVQLLHRHHTRYCEFT